jgi:two-component system response regulator AtoC
MARVMQLLEKVARVDSTVLITGESGTGKELIAKAVHKISKRSKKPLVAVNCGAIPHSLIESELFGYKKGAFTDAGSDKEGFFKQADEGTLFLDEIGDLPLSLQVKLLRVLQEGTFRPLGASKDEKVDVRIIAATAINLNMSVKTGDFREDLFYRLNVLPVKLPPLRERIEDILLICDHFIKTNNIKFANKIKGLSKEASKMLISYQWPGNVRELQNAMERAHVLCDGEYIAKQDLPPQIAQSSGIIQSALSQDELSIKKTTRIIEEELIRKALAKTGGNRTKASKLLEISHRALLYKIKEFNI